MSKLNNALCTFLLVGSSLLLSGNSIAQTTNCCKSRYSPAIQESLDIKNLGKEYRRLKRIHCDDCNSSRSDYYSIMLHLGDGLNGKTKAQIIKIMGSPDSRKEGTYIYFWRGWHDYLYFTFTSGKGRTQWYHAYE